MGFEAALESLLCGRDLSASGSKNLFRALFQGDLDPVRARAVVLLMARKGESGAELLGCVTALRELEPPFDSGLRGLIDTCGTGGDGQRTANLSTLAAIVAAGAGARVAKHGNRAVTSAVGSSDLMEALGVRLEVSRARMVRAIREGGLGYFHAPSFHPVFARVQPLRRQLKVRTIFNLLGPLVNPLRLQGQTVGVSREPLLEKFASVLAARGIRRAVIFRSQDGLDELSPFARARCVWIENGKVRRSTLDPRRYGFGSGSPAGLSGGSVQKNRAMALALLGGKLQGPVRDAVLLNAAAAVWAAGRAETLDEGLEKSRRSILNGDALKALQTLVRISRTGS